MLRIMPNRYYYYARYVTNPPGSPENLLISITMPSSRFNFEDETVSSVMKRKSAVAIREPRRVRGKIFTDKDIWSLQATKFY